MYDKQIATIYAVENGFVVECREKKPETKTKKDAGCCIPSSTETKTYTAKSANDVMKIVREKLGSKASAEYSEGFKAEAAQK